MPEGSKKPPSRQAPERSQAPLWFVIAGLAIAVFSRGMRDENIGDVVFWFGAVFAVIAFLYWLIRPKHGLR